MISVDTNLLVYASNPDAPAHERALALMQSLADQEIALCQLVLVELYMALRNPAVFAQPYSAKEAAEHCRNLSRNPRWLYVDYEPEVAPRLWEWAGKTRAGFRRIIDARLALTLRHHGVTEFATVNVKDFQDFGFRRLWNPLQENS